MNQDDFLNEMKKILGDVDGMDDLFNDLEDVKQDVKHYQALCVILEQFYIQKPDMLEQLDATDAEVSARYRRVYQNKGVELTQEEADIYTDFTRKAYDLMALVSANYDNWISKGMVIQENMRRGV